MIRADAGYRHLALRVIDQAFRDLAGSAATGADQESARTFLAGSRMLYRWCEIANVSAAVTIARATELRFDVPRSTALSTSESGARASKHSRSIERGNGS